MTELKKPINQDLNLAIKKVQGQSDTVAEKVFQSRNPKGLAAKDIISTIKKTINSQPSSLSSEQYISYQSVENIAGEYYLLRAGENLLPLKEYLKRNEVEKKTIIKWWKSILALFREADKLDLGWKGINPISLWVNDKDEICLIDPLATHQISNYREQLKFDFDKKLLLAPEILEGDTWSTEAQIYSISSFFYYLLTAKPLFTSAQSGKILAEIKRIKPLNPHIIEPQLSAELSDLVLSCLNKKKEDRPNDFTAVIKQLQSLESEEQIIATPEERKKTKDKQSRAKTLFKFKKRGFWLAYKYGKLTAAILLALGVLASFAMSGGYQPVIEKDTSSQQVVKYFYKSIDNKSINLLKETVNLEQLPHIESMIINGYIIETTKNLFSAPPEPVRESETKNKTSNRQQKKVPQNKKRLFEINGLTITNIESDRTPEYEANYYFVFKEKKQAVRIKMQDKLILNKIKGKWKIKKITGDIQSRQFLRKKERKLKGK